MNLLHESVRTVRADDADELACHLTNWQQEYDQMASGNFHGMLAERWAGQLQVFRESINQPVRQTCRLWPGAVWFGIGAGPEPVRLNGRPVGAHEIMVMAAGSEFELVTPRSHCMLGVVTSRELLVDAARKAGGIDWESALAGNVLRIPAGSRNALEMALERLLAGDRSDGRDAVLGEVIGMLEEGRPAARAADSLERRRRIVRVAREYIAAHQDQAVGVRELCQQVHVSRRTLHNAFDSVLGVSPALFVKLWRLNGVRRQLRQSGDGSRIGALAGAWGLANFSQFCCDYKRLFGRSATESRR